MDDGEEPQRDGGVRHAGAVCLVVRAETKPGADLDVGAILADFAHRVRAEEPECSSYVITREIGSRSRFAAHARFVSWDGFRRHGETPHIEAVLARLTPQLASPLSMEIFLEV